LIYASLGSIAVIASVLVLRRRRKRVMTTSVAASVAASIAEPETQAEARTSKTPSPQSSFKANVSTGYRELDSMLEGGIPDGYAVVIVSPPFDERDLLVRRTIASAITSGRPTFYLSTDIAKTRDLINKFGQNFYALNPFADKIATDRDNLFKIPDVGDLSNLNISSNEIIESKARNEPSKMIVIDLLSDLLLRNKARTTRRWLTEFAAKRKANGFTILATLDPSTAPQEEIQTLIGAFDGVIEVYEKPLQERSRRFLVIKKMYGRNYSESELMLDKDKLF
jgi:KaiC/GvpD/RAD55 family RecA-like ATPase